MVSAWVSAIAQAGNPFEVYRNGEIPPASAVFEPFTDEEIKTGSSNPYEIVRDDGIEESLSDRENETSEAISPSFGIENLPISSSTSSQANPFEIGQSATSIIDEEKTYSPATEPEVRTQPGTIPRKTGSNSFIFWFLLLSTILLTTGITSNRKGFKNLYRLISNQNYLKLQNREQKGGKNLFYTLLYISFILNISIFIYLGYSYFAEISRVSALLKIIVIVTIVYGLRHVFMNFLRYFVDSKYLVSDYDFMITVINVILGLILLPIVLFTGFSGFQYVGLILGSVVIVTLYFIRQIKGIMAAMNSNETGVFHFFIYLCTFEIGPILIALRLLKDYSGIM